MLLFGAAQTAVQHSSDWYVLFNRFNTMQTKSAQTGMCCLIYLNTCKPNQPRIQQGSHPAPAPSPQHLRVSHFNSTPIKSISGVTFQINSTQIIIRCARVSASAGLWLDAPGARAALWLIGAPGARAANQRYCPTLRRRQPVRPARQQGCQHGTVTQLARSAGGAGEVRIQPSPLAGRCCGQCGHHWRHPAQEVDALHGGRGGGG